MNGELQALIGKQVQVASALDTTTGVVVSADGSALTLRTSELSGYEMGSYAIFQLRLIAYIRVL
ncbi:hypothetical protein [Paenibacillus methanolicus]|uniref:Uncharacterized protein n=1 Tax=Paenibacillus methanolicus TaxID=582686 RepID=A0A5S5C7I9_9BACL|nr:hypothetical protein [Paenibacillus methanolicus]TYP73953.1 hypothetical protein BCM02_106232 [Paenibacillus methanolicus]